MNRPETSSEQLCRHLNTDPEVITFWSQVKRYWRDGTFEMQDGRKLTRAQLLAAWRSYQGR